jgi:hypothetical protein
MAVNFTAPADLALARLHHVCDGSPVPPVEDGYLFVTFARNAQVPPPSPR